MHTRQTFLLSSLRAIQGFLDDNKDAIGSINDSGARKSLDALVQQITSQAVDQTAGRITGRGATSLEASLRASLRESHMKPIARIAKARLRHVPEMRSFTVPNKRTSSIRLIAMAGGMAEAAAKHASVFAERGLPQDFIARLTTAADALRQSLDARAKSHGQTVGATTALLALSRQATSCIHELDALVTPQLANNDRLLGAWRVAKRVRRKPGPNAESTTTTAPVPDASAEQPAA